VSKFVD